MPNPCDMPAPASACVPNVADPRVVQSFKRRFSAATRDALIPIAAHTTNGDEAAYGDKCGTYTKCVKQKSAGVVDPIAFTAFRKAIDSGKFTDFQAVPMGGGRTLNGPMASYALNYDSLDASQYGVPEVPVPPALKSEEYATELIELYWCSLLRDVAFSDLSTSQIAIDAAQELSTLTKYAGPTNGGVVTPALLFRGTYDGEQYGPYISQFFLTPTKFGAQAISQQYTTFMPGMDFMTTLPDWEKVQNGMPTLQVITPDPTPRYLHNGRGLAAYTHADELYQSYFMAYLALQTLKAPLNPGNPYLHSATQNGFGTFGGPDIASTLATVAKLALNACWYQKWVVHLRHRPESGGGMVHLIQNGVTFDGAPNSLIFNSAALKKSFMTWGSYLLSQAFPEGSPAHPSYPTGHGAVGGACITVLKFFYEGDWPIPSPMMPTSDGINLVPWNGDPNIGGPGPLTVNGELHKLAHNVTFGHGLHGGIHWRTDSDASMTLGEAVALSYLNDLACTYAEPFKVTITKLDGTPAVITNM